MQQEAKAAKAEIRGRNMKNSNHLNSMIGHISKANSPIWEDLD
jgi:hypothetical protein